MNSAFRDRPALERVWTLWHRLGGGDGHYHRIADVLPGTELLSDATWFALQSLIEEGYLVGEAPPRPSGISPFYLKSTRFCTVQ